MIGMTSGTWFNSTANKSPSHRKTRPVLKIARTPQAKADLVEHIIYLAERNPDIADRFVTATEVAFEKLATTPFIGAEYNVQSP